VLVAAADAVVATKTRELRVANTYRQGLARFRAGWIFSGPAGLWRTDGQLRVVDSNPAAIPADLVRRGFDHIGDVDVAGVYLYAPLEQGDYERGQQVMARYDARTLEFVDAVNVEQHHNSFVAVDARSGLAYTMDRFGGDALLRYDLGGLRWRRLPPLRLDRRVENVQGADLAEGFAYLSTSDPRNSLYRVDLGSGKVTALGSAGHAGGEGEGIDATATGGARVHTLTIGTDGVSVFLAGFDVPRPSRTGSAEKMIIAFTIVATLIATAVIIVVTRRNPRQ
jgi:hypothetical protein